MTGRRHAYASISRARQPDRDLGVTFEPGLCTLAIASHPSRGALTRTPSSATATEDRTTAWQRRGTQFGSAPPAGRQPAASLGPWGEADSAAVSCPSRGGQRPLKRPGDISHPNPTAHLVGAGEALLRVDPRGRTSPRSSASQDAAHRDQPGRLDQRNACRQGVRRARRLRWARCVVGHHPGQRRTNPPGHLRRPTARYESSAAPAFGDSSFSATTVATSAAVALRAPGHAIAPASRALQVSRGTGRHVIGASRLVYGPITPVKAGAPGSSEFGAAVMAIAARYAGIAYVYGGTTPAGFDCSGYVRYVMAQVGVSLPRTSSEQRAATVRNLRQRGRPRRPGLLPRPRRHLRRQRHDVGLPAHGRRHQQAGRLLHSRPTSPTP